MRKPFLKQKQNNNSFDIEECIGLLLIIVISMLFIVMAVQDWMTLKNWDDGGILEYQGSYTFYENNIPRHNTLYIFELGNDATVFVSSREIVHNDVDFESFEELTFRYTAHKDIFRLGKHKSVSITTTDNSLLLQQEEASKRELRGFAILWSVFAVVCSSLIIIPLSFDIYISILHYSWKRQKIRKKRKSKKQ